MKACRIKKNICIFYIQFIFYMHVFFIVNCNILFFFFIFYFVLIHYIWL